MKKKRYLIQFDMAGLHDCVYLLKPYGELPEWFDKSENISANPKQPFIFVREGITQILFKNKKEANKALKILLAYKNHIQRHL